MKKSGLTLTDRLGIFYGTMVFFITLPLTLFLSSIPTMIVSNAISNRVLSLTINMGIIGVGILLTFLEGMVVGLALSYALSWIGRKLQVQQTVSKVVTNEVPAGFYRKANYGALIGAGLAAIGFILHGETPINSVTTRVEHLFPAPLVLSLSNISFDLSHTYAAATGFLSVCFLFVIAGVVAGSLVSATLTKVVAHQQN